MSANTPLPSRYPYHVYVERDTGERELSKDKRESQEGSLLYLKYTGTGEVEGDGWSTQEGLRTDTRRRTRGVHGVFRWCNQKRDQASAKLRTTRPDRV